MVERDRLKAEREAKAQRGGLFTTTAPEGVDVWAAGIELVWRMIR
jgi:hypothetical protein